MAMRDANLSRRLGRCTLSLLTVLLLTWAGFKITKHKGSCPQPYHSTRSYACREHFRTQGLCSSKDPHCVWPYRDNVGKTVSASWELFCMTVVDGVITECVT